MTTVISKYPHGCIIRSGLVCYPGIFEDICAEDPRSGNKMKSQVFAVCMGLMYICFEMTYVIIEVRSVVGMVDGRSVTGLLMILDY